MLRIHIEKQSGGVSLRLEGTLVQPWTHEFVRVWMDLTADPGQSRVTLIDLEAVSFLDAEACGILAAIRRLGCRLEGSGPYISTVIKEISSDASH